MPDPLYVRARVALLDAVEALGIHRDAIVPVGAQAIYLHTGAADLAVAEYTTDADFSLRPGVSVRLFHVGRLLPGPGGFPCSGRFMRLV